MWLIKLHLNCRKKKKVSYRGGKYGILISHMTLKKNTRKAAGVHPDVPKMFAVCLKANFMAIWKHLYENKWQSQTEGTNDIVVKNKTPTTSNAIV